MKCVVLILDNLQVWAVVPILVWEEILPPPTYDKLRTSFLW